MRSPCPNALIRVVVCFAGVFWLLSGACTDRGRQPPPETRPAGAQPAGTEPAVTTSPVEDTETQPASRPASQPADALPASTFSTEPPYTVQLFVRKPEDRQPGWLKVLTLADKDATAIVGGAFPEQNRIEVKTDNVRRIQLELGYLPIAEGRRVVLHIDDQGIELTQRDRKFVTLERRLTGQWVVERPARE